MIAEGWTIGSPVAWITAGAVTTVKATVVLLAAAGAVRLLGLRSAALRHSVWTAALAASLLLPVLVAGLPERVRFAPIEVPAAWTVSSGSQAAARTSAAPNAEGARPGGTTSARPDRDGKGIVGLPLPTGFPVDAVGWILALLWAGGAGVVVARTAGGWWRLRRIRGRADPLSDDAWKRRARERWAAMGGDGSPRIRVSPEISAPLTFGVLRPTLLLPQEALDTWSRSRTEAVLVHELAHLRRRDTFTQLLGRLACAAYWFHPLAWRAERAAAAERERACDDTVLRGGARASEYARHLMATAREVGAGVAGASVPVVRGPDFEGRILSLLERDADRRPVTRGAVAGTGLPALGLAVVLAALSVDTAPGPGQVDRTTPPSVQAPPRAVEAGAAETAGVLDELLEAPDPETRSAAAEEIGRRRMRNAVGPLTEALEDPSPEVREEAAEALAELEDPSAVAALRRAVLSDRSLGVRKRAAWALGETESSAAVEALDEALAKVGNRWLEKRIARALGETRQPSAVPVLRGLLETRDPRMREAALEGLEENGTEPARVALDAALESDDPDLRARAADVLGRGG